MKTKHYDVFVIGSGIAGQTAAKICNDNNLTVAITDIREYGGVCSNRGCDPKKILLQFADLVSTSNNLKGHGITEIPEHNWQQVQNFKKTFTDSIPNRTEEDLKELGIDLYHQSPYFVGEKEIMVEGKKISADKFVIATGNVPRDLLIEGSEHAKNSEDVLNLQEIPESVIFVGSGYVAMEFAFMLATLGAKVTIVEINKVALSNFDQYLVEKLVKKLESVGVTFIFNAETQSIEELRSNYRLTYDQKNKTNTIKAKMVVNATGRVPSISALQLEKASIVADENGIVVNKNLQSLSNPAIYACGDVSSMSLPLTPLSGLQGYIVGHNIVKERSKEFDVPCVPSVVFTSPQLASVGMSEDMAKTRIKNIKVYQGDASHWFNAQRSREDTYAYKIVANQRTGEILGAHLLASHACETINIFATAIYNKMTVQEFKKMIFTYPSYSQDLKKMMAND